MAGYIQWLRQLAGPHLLPLAYATALIRDEAGRILFQRRADFGSAWWGLPGGLLEPRETPVACLQREVVEETGLHVEPVRFVGVYSSPRYNVTYPNGDQVQQITTCHECRMVGGELRPDADEILGLEFFAPEAMPPLPVWYADMVADAIQGRHTQVPPYFDPPDQQAVNTPFTSLISMRPVVGHAPLVWPGASVAVRDEAGRILLQQRGDTGTWSLPAGALDTGETLAHTAIRETEEETGLLVEPIRLVDVYSGWQVTYPNGDQLYPVAFLFLCGVVGGELRADGHESLAVDFFAPDQLPPIYPNMLERIQHALALPR